MNLDALMSPYVQASGTVDEPSTITDVHAAVDSDDARPVAQVYADRHDVVAPRHRADVDIEEPAVPLAMIPRHRALAAVPV